MRPAGYIKNDGGYLATMNATGIAGTVPRGWWRYDTGVSPTPADPWNQSVTTWANQGSVGGNVAPSGLAPKTAEGGVLFGSKSQNLQHASPTSAFITTTEWTAAAVIVVLASTIDESDTWKNPGTITDYDNAIWGLHIRHDATVGGSGYDSFYAQAYQWDGAAAHTSEVLVSGGDHSSQGPYLQLSQFDSASGNLITTVWDISSAAGAVLIGTDTTASVPAADALTGVLSVGNNSMMSSSTHQRNTLEALTWQRLLDAGEQADVLAETLARWGT